MRRDKMRDYQRKTTQHYLEQGDPETKHIKVKHLE